MPKEMGNNSHYYTRDLSLPVYFDLDLKKYFHILLKNEEGAPNE